MIPVLVPLLAGLYVGPQGRLGWVARGDWTYKIRERIQFLAH